jgi:NAD(P)-dependent dehydrogenase (short-subunit alcohol dehydrogenase family)
MVLSAELPSRILVTGCASGIGHAGARMLAEAGCRLALLDNQETRLLRMARELDAVALPVDVSDHAALAQAVTGAIEALGGLDAAWSNAGIQQGGDVEEATVEALDYSYAVNVRAHFVLAKQVVPHLRARGGGRLLITASNSGLQPETALVPYSVSKGATIALARQLAHDHAADGIRVNALCPGYVDTPFNAAIWHPFGGREGFLEKVAEYVPLGRMASAEEVAKVGCWLLSDAATYMTGANVVIDGGELIG